MTSSSNQYIHWEGTSSSSTTSPASPTMDERKHMDIDKDAARKPKSLSDIFLGTNRTSLTISKSHHNPRRSKSTQAAAAAAAGNITPTTPRKHKSHRNISHGNIGGSLRRVDVIQEEMEPARPRSMKGITLNPLSKPTTRSTSDSTSTALTSSSSLEENQRHSRRSRNTPTNRSTRRKSPHEPILNDTQDNSSSTKKEKATRSKASREDGMSSNPRKPSSRRPRNGASRGGVSQESPHADDDNEDKNIHENMEDTDRSPLSPKQSTREKRLSKSALLTTRKRRPEVRKSDPSINATPAQSNGTEKSSSMRRSARRVYSAKENSGKLRSRSSEPSFNAQVRLRSHSSESNGRNSAVIEKTRRKSSTKQRSRSKDPTIESRSRSKDPSYSTTPSRSRSKDSSHYVSTSRSRSKDPSHSASTSRSRSKDPAGEHAATIYEANRSLGINSDSVEMNVKHASPSSPSRSAHRPNRRLRQHSSGEAFESPSKHGNPKLSPTSPSKRGSRNRKNGKNSNTRTVDSLKLKTPSTSRLSLTHRKENVYDSLPKNLEEEDDEADFVVKLNDCSPENPKSPTRPSIESNEEVVATPRQGVRRARSQDHLQAKEYDTKEEKSALERSKSMAFDTPTNSPKLSKPTIGTSNTSPRRSRRRARSHDNFQTDEDTSDGIDINETKEESTKSAAHTTSQAISMSLRSFDKEGDNSSQHSGRHVPSHGHLIQTEKEIADATHINDKKKVLEGNKGIEASGFQDMRRKNNGSNKPNQLKDVLTKNDNVHAGPAIDDDSVFDAAFLTSRKTDTFEKCLNTPVEENDSNTSDPSISAFTLNSPMKCSEQRNFVVRDRMFPDSFVSQSQQQGVCNPFVKSTEKRMDVRSDGDIVEPTKPKSFFNEDTGIADDFDVMDQQLTSDMGKKKGFKEFLGNRLRKIGKNGIASVDAPQKQHVGEISKPVILGSPVKATLETINGKLANKMFSATPMRPDKLRISGQSLVRAFGKKKVESFDTFNDSGALSFSMDLAVAHSKEEDKKLSRLSPETPRRGLFRRAVSSRNFDDKSANILARNRFGVNTVKDRIEEDTTGRGTNLTQTQVTKESNSEGPTDVQFDTFKESDFQDDNWAFNKTPNSELSVDPVGRLENLLRQSEHQSKTSKLAEPSVCGNLENDHTKNGLDLKRHSFLEVDPVGKLESLLNQSEHRPSTRVMEPSVCETPFSVDAHDDNDDDTDDDDDDVDDVVKEDDLKLHHGSKHSLSRLFTKTSTHLGAKSKVLPSVCESVNEAYQDSSSTMNLDELVQSSVTSKDQQIDTQQSLSSSQKTTMTLEEQQRHFLQLNIPGFDGNKSGGSLAVTQHDVMG